MLLLSAIGAVTLHFGRERWSSESWFTIAVGITAAFGIIPLISWVSAYFETRSKRNLHLIVFFAVFSITCGAFVPFAYGEDKRLALSLFCIAGISVWATLGTIFKWPGFRNPTVKCPLCLQEMSENDGYLCPQCGYDICGDEVPWKTAVTYHDLHEATFPLHCRKLCQPSDLKLAFSAIEKREPFVFALVSELGFTLTIGYGQRGFVQHSIKIGEPPCMAAIADKTDFSDRCIEFLCGDTLKSIPIRYCLPNSTIRQIIVDFVRDGSRSSIVEWEEV